MILHRLELRRFLGLPDDVFEFAPGLNVVVGPNEAGKSTLRTAIRTVLYENPATASARYREQYRSWQADDPPELRLHFELAGRRFTLTKNYATRKVVLADAVTGQTWEQHKPVQERLVAALGLPTDDLFDATAHIAQTHLERIHITSIGRELGTVIGGGGEDVAAALRRLENHIRALERGSRGAAVKEPGRLTALERGVSELRREVDELRRNAAEADRARAELAAVSADNVRFAGEFAAKKRLLESNREIVQLEQRLAGLKANEKHWERKIRQIEEYAGKLDGLDRALETATASGVPAEERVAEARTLQERLRARERDLEALVREEAAPEVAAGPGRLAGALAGAGLLLAGLGVGLLLAGRGAGLPAVRGTEVPAGQGAELLAGRGAELLAGRGGELLRLMPVAGWVALVLGASALIAGGIGLWRRMRFRQTAAVRREERGRRRSALEAEIADIGTAHERVLAALGCTSLQEAEARLDAYRNLVQERRRVSEFLASLREGSTDEAIAEQWNTVRRDIFGLEERLRAPEVAAKRLTPLQVQTLEREVAALEQAVAEVQRREMRLTATLERLAADAEQLVAKEEQLQDAEEELQRVRRHVAVCRLALEALAEARRQAEIPVREIAQKKAGEYLRVATGGRYARVRVEGESLDLAVWSDEAAGWVPAEEPGLSRGTVDLVYLAVRLALVEVLTHGRRPPLLFDDPFITFDERRREGAVQLLRELSRTYQVILFTCSPEYARHADRVITIPDRIGASVPAGAPGAPVPAGVSASTALSAPADGPAFTAPSNPMDTPAPIAPPTPADTPAPTAQSTPTDTPAPTAQSTPTDTPAPTVQSTPTGAPASTEPPVVGPLWEKLDG